MPIIIGEAVGTNTASDIIDEASSIYNDTDFDRVDQEPGGDNVNNWFDFLNAGQIQLVVFRPQANVINSVYKLVEGTKQRIPNGTSDYIAPDLSYFPEGIQLIRIVRNMGTDGLIAGSPVTVADVETMDREFADWHSETGSATVFNYMYDERDPFTFWVTPPQPAADQGFIEAQISYIPIDIAAVDDVINLSDIYYHALLEYMLYRGYLIDSDSSPMAAQRATWHFNQFVSLIGRKDLLIKDLSPNKPQGMERVE